MMAGPERTNHETEHERVEHTAPAERRPRDPRPRDVTTRAIGETALDGAQQRDPADVARELGRLALRRRDDRAR